LFSRSVFSMLGEVLTPKILGSSTKYLIFFLTVQMKIFESNQKVFDIILVLFTFNIFCH